ncbi:MAG: hypothetical protein RIN56_01285 [Sporomusaceae bacterium]|nr:hypothetical protein [Sporomusaceae bacterium]
MTSFKVSADIEAIDLILDVLEHNPTKNSSNVIETIKRELLLPHDSIMDSLYEHPFILTKCAYALSLGLGNNIGIERRKRLGKMYGQYFNMKGQFIRIRKFLSSGGYYYGRTVETSKGIYTFWGYEPILITKSKETPFPNWFVHMTRQEVRVLSSLALSTEIGTLTFQPSDECYDVPYDLVMNNETRFSENALRRAQAVTCMLARLSAKEFWGYKNSYQISVPYEFSSTVNKPEKIHNIYNSFKESNRLVVRTCFLLLKAQTLWNDPRRIYGEDACANLFFGIEGCLKLISKDRAKLRTFEIKPVLEHIYEVFKHAPGYVYMLQDVYEKRIQIVHPESRTGTSWVPELDSEDFYENYEMAVDLIYYAITGELLPRQL